MSGAAVKAVIGASVRSGELPSEPGRCRQNRGEVKDKTEARVSVRVVPPRWTNAPEEGKIKPCIRETRIPSGLRGWGAEVRCGLCSNDV